MAIVPSARGMSFAAPVARSDVAPRRSGVGGGPLRWPFLLLAAFLFLLFANLPLLVPAIGAAAPAQTMALAALALLFLEVATTRASFRLAWPESHLLLAFLGIAVVSSFSALWTRHALEQCLVLLKMLVIYLLMVNVLRSWARLRVALGALVVGGLFPAVGALWNVHQGRLVEGRAAWLGVFQNPNDLAYGLVVLVPFAIRLSLRSRGWSRLGLWAAIGLFVAAIFYTYSRGGLLALAIVAALAFWRWSPGWARLPGIALGVAAAVVAVAFLWARPAGFSDLHSDFTVQERLETVRAGLAMFADRPLLGVGLGCSVIGWPLYAPPGAVTEGWLHCHNTYVQALGETGTLGAAAFLGALGIGLFKARRLAAWWRRRGHREQARTVAALEISLWGFLAASLAGGYVLAWSPYLLLGLVSAASLLPREETTEVTR